MRGRDIAAGLGAAACLYWLLKPREASAASDGGFTPLGPGVRFPSDTPSAPSNKLITATPRVTFTIAPAALPARPVAWAQGYKAVRKLARALGQEVAAQVRVSTPGISGLRRAGRRAEPFLRRALLAEWARVGPEIGFLHGVRVRDDGAQCNAMTVSSPDGFRDTDIINCGDASTYFWRTSHAAINRACAERYPGIDTVVAEYSWDWIIDGRGEFSGFGPYALFDARLEKEVATFGSDYRKRKLAAFYRVPSRTWSYGEAFRFWFMDSICYHVAPNVSYEIVSDARSLTDLRLELMIVAATPVADKLSDLIVESGGNAAAAELHSRLIQAIGAAIVLTTAPEDFDFSDAIAVVLRVSVALAITVFTQGAGAGAAISFAVPSLATVAAAGAATLRNEGLSFVANSFDVNLPSGAEISLSPNGLVVVTQRG